MKHRQTLAIIAAALIAAFSSLQAQESIPVYLSPDVESKIVGNLESLSLAVTAEWPEGTEPFSGWRPIYYQGSFEVYVSSHDISKDLTPKPGCAYLMAPEPDAQILAIATAEDSSELIAVDPRYCKVQVETIILAYIQDIPAAVEEEDQAVEVEKPESPKIAITAEETEPAKILEGRLITTSLIESKKTGYAYKLVNDQRKTIAFLDTSKLPEFVMLRDYVDTISQASGKLIPQEKIASLVLEVSALKKVE